MYPIIWFLTFCSFFIPKPLWVLLWFFNCQLCQISSKILFSVLRWEHHHPRCVWIVFTPIDTIFIIQQQLLSSIPFFLLQCGSSFDDGFSHIQGCSFVMLPIFGFRGEIYQKKILHMYYLVLLWCCYGNLHKFALTHTDNSLNLQCHGTWIDHLYILSADNSTIVW